LTASRFFQPDQLHLEPPNLLEELGFPCSLLLEFSHVLLTEDSAAAVEHLLLPLGDLPQMHRVFAVELAECLLLFHRFSRDPELEVGTPSLTFLGHRSLHMLPADPTRSKQSMWSSFRDQL
jgi:hypothetical protein